VVADFSTAATAEGVVRSLRHRGLAAPEGWLRDADGHSTTDPSVLYAMPKGTIQPLGGPLGYRGTALALFVEVLTTLMSGESIDDRSRVGTDMTVLAIMPGAGFDALALRLSDHIRRTAPLDPAQPVLMPGDRERLAASGTTLLQVDPPTWAALGVAAAAANLVLPETRR
jgi:LDH2 family malate/lactate/ureidoglycolate dehydrogenase